ncbi:MAG: hypothetical protein Q4G14_14555 [Paracoccus sp. (in: a-proteobacteria)]|uniref:phage tail terminator protein n=1 Tax=Paracoccus sp. TaxID=267 RepID=UPI0026DF627B|nr:hypothetical protein [Paracoccus sp. (in: a-proteobacteria)]MDO5614449.1 hypothetical protein [Paracoccus sp. (in: a-proteobacteria)]
MISDIITRLERPGVFAQVDLAEDMDALMRGTARPSGTVFVMPYRESADPNGLATGFRQRVSVQIVTAIIMRINDDPRGASRARALETYRHAVECALIGQTPAGAATPLELIGGEGSALTDNVSLYVQTWETTRYIVKGP